MSTVDFEFAEECLNHHNALRTKHGSPDLVLDSLLCDFAQEWAMNIASRDVFEHRQDNDYGENLYIGSSSDPNFKLEPKVPVLSWYDEISSYRFGEATPANLAEVRHFAQVVWRGSEKLGVGVAASESGKVYVVCNYHPAGNVLGKFTDNVMEVAEATLTESRDTMAAASKTTADSITQKLDTIPPEGLKVWTTWLTKVAEVAADEWQQWLQAHINLTLRLNERLLAAKQNIEKVEKRRGECGCRESDAAEERLEREVTYGDERAADKVVSDKELHAKTDGNKEQKDAAAEHSLSSIGTVLDAEKTEVKVIPMPKDENEVLLIVERFKLQARKYQRLYQRWLGQSDKVIEEIVEKSTEQVYTHEEIPYFSYLREQLEVDTRIESDDDEEILRLQDGRERITCNEFHLFFNLTEGRGEK